MATCYNCKEHIPNKDLIQACSFCRTKFVHPECLKAERNQKSWKYANQCTFCNHTYATLPVDISLPAKFFMYVFRDGTLIMSCILFLWFVNRLFAQVLDETFCPSYAQNCLVKDRFFPSGWSEAVVYWICGLVLFLAEIGLYGSISSVIQACSSSSSSSSYRGGSNTYGNHYHESNHYYGGGRSNFFCCSGGGGSSSSSRSSKGDGAGIAVWFLIVVILFASIGIFYGFYIAVDMFRWAVRRHVEMLKTKVVVEAYPVAEEYIPVASVIA
jgi:hypothetical protein